MELSTCVVLSVDEHKMEKNYCKRRGHDLKLMSSSQLNQPNESVLNLIRDWGKGDRSGRKNVRQYFMIECSEA